MNAKDFLDLMGEIDGDLIVNAKEPVAPRRAPAWRKLTVIAAAACLLVGVLSALVLIGTLFKNLCDIWRGNRACDNRCLLCNPRKVG